MKLKHFAILAVLFCIILLLTSSCFAEEPALTIAQDVIGATFYDFGTDQLLIGGILSVMSYRKLISLDVGLLTEMSSISYMFGIGINLKTLADKLNLDFELNENVKLGGYMARDFKLKVYRYGIFIGVILQI